VSGQEEFQEELVCIPGKQELVQECIQDMPESDKELGKVSVLVSDKVLGKV
jgi:hypothetical protein